MAEDKEKKYIKIGKRYKTQKGWAFECGLLPLNGVFQSYCFKDEEVYTNEPDEVCYVDDLCFRKWFDLVIRGEISKDEEEEVFEKCENDELKTFVWEGSDHEKEIYGSAVWSHKSLLVKSTEFLKKNPRYAAVDPEQLAYKVFVDAKEIITVYPSGEPLNEPDNFTKAAQELIG